MSGAILVIEDDTATVELIHEALEAEGHTVLHASGAAGLALARVALPAVILLDINMPGMDGPEVSRLLRADPRTARVPTAMRGTRRRVGAILTINDLARHNGRCH